MRLALLCIGIGLALPALADEVDGRRSGYSYLGEETRALQDDAFANPGMLWAERGQALWSTAEGALKKSCADCHGDAGDSMKGVRARYPVYDPALGRPVNLEQRINQCRRERMQAPPWPWEREELLAIAAFVAHQSHGMPVQVRIDGPVAPHFERPRRPPSLWRRDQPGPVERLSGVPHALADHGLAAAHVPLVQQLGTRRALSLRRGGVCRSRGLPGVARPRSADRDAGRAALKTARLILWNQMPAGGLILV
jgi:mono/diheme cytochrome c family protein